MNHQRYSGIKFLFIFSILFFILTSCGNGKLRGYRKFTKQFGLKYVQNLDTGTQSGTGVFMIAHALIKNEFDSIVSDPSFGDTSGFSLQIPLKNPSSKNDLMQAFQELSDGDSAIIRMVADSFFSKINMNRKLPSNVKTGSFVSLQLKVVDLMNEGEHEKWLKEQEIQEKASAYNFFQSYLNAVGVPYEPVGSGIVMDIKKEGTGKNPIYGQYVLVNYIIMTFSGNELSNTFTEQHPVSFVLGSEEMIYGINEAILRMKKGGISRVYIPYYLAYGKNGIPGKVEPYMHLVVDLELLDIQ